HEEPQLVLPEEAPLALDQRERLVEVSGPEALEPAAHPPRARDPVGIDESLLERRERRDLLAGRHRAGRAEATHADATPERRDREQPGGGLHARTPGQYDARALRRRCARAPARGHSTPDAGRRWYNASIGGRP